MKEYLKSNKAIRKIFFLVKDIEFLSMSTWRGFLKWDVRIAVICWIRFVVLVKLLGKVQFYKTSNEKVAKETIQHNYKGLSLLSIKSFSGSRPKELFQLLDGIKSINKTQAQILIVGPRAESEFYLAKAFGFKIKNCTGLDLISYSPHVRLGDMHEMPFDDNSFDIIVVGWVLAYSNNLPLAISEIIRIGRSNSIVIQGTQYYPLTIEETTKKLGYTPGANKRIENNNQIKKLFGGHIGHVYHDIDITQHAPHMKSEMILSLSITK